MVHVIKEMGATKFVRDELYSWQDIVGTVYRGRIKEFSILLRSKKSFLPLGLVI